MINLTCDFYYKSLIKHNEILCGDKVVYHKNDDNSVIVLSDGLGSGVKANILATLTSQIISKMMSNSCDIIDVIDTISKTLPICSVRNVAYSTFTLMQVFNDGRVLIYEYDNPLIIIIRDNKILNVNRNKMIIQDKVIYETSLIGCDNDVFVMFSDGVINASCGKFLDLNFDHKKVEEFLIEYYKKSYSALNVVDLLIDNINSLYEFKPLDDTSVAVVKLIKNKTSIMLIGPSSNIDDDEKLVRDLMSCDGQKIVCGGQTSKIVARCLDRSVLNVDNEFANNYSHVPPISKIDGIDLVTEGILTLRQCNEYLQDFINGNEDLYYYDYGYKDGANYLAKTLVNKCTNIIIKVGLSKNEAHINDNNICFSEKVKQVLKLELLLKKLNKNVLVEFY